MSDACFTDVRCRRQLSPSFLRSNMCILYIGRGKNDERGTAAATAAAAKRTREIFKLHLLIPYEIDA